jgi:divalent metal cation (Fe/Co/Zn/Cd) transporter
VILNNPVLQTEGRVTLIDSILAAAVLVGNTTADWWWTDPVAAYVLYYGSHEARLALTSP